VDGQGKSIARDGAPSSFRPQVILFLLHCNIHRLFISLRLDYLTPTYLKYIVLLDRSTVRGGP
jgi:hypothetical protein